MAAEGAYPKFYFSPLHLLCPEHLRNCLQLPPTLDRNTSAAALPVNYVTTLHTLRNREGDNLKLIEGHKRMDPFNILGGKSLMANSGTAGHANLQKFKSVLKALSPSTPARTGTWLGESCGKSLVPVCLRLPYRCR